MGVAENPPEGIVFHTASQIDGGIRIFDVWESREQLERFLEERVAPAVAEVMGGQGGAPTRHEVVELHNFIRL